MYTQFYLAMLFQFLWSSIIVYIVIHHYENNDIIIETYSNLFLDIGIGNVIRAGHEDQAASYVTYYRVRDILYH